MSRDQLRQDFDRLSFLSSLLNTMKPSSLSFVILLHFEVRNALSFFESLPGDTDVFRNPKCGSDKSGKDSSSCDCAEFNALCVRSGCGECKCRRKTRIYRSDVRKCLSDLEARDPCKWLSFLFS